MSKYIHYYLNDEKKIADFSQKCLDSWKEFLPEEYEIKFWSSDDLKDIDDEIAHKAATYGNYELKKDFIKVYAMYKYGGIYVDQNMKLINKIDDLIDNSTSFLGLDERHNVCGSLWYEAKPKSYLATKVYKLFEKNIDEGIYNHYYLSLPLLLREALEDYDPSKKTTQKLKHDIILYGYDYFYPLSYDGHNKNKSSNTRCLNYFDYNFITPKGKLKNFISSIIGQKLTVVLYKFLILMKKILRFILQPLLNKRRLLRKNTPEHKELIQSTIEKINQKTDEYYVAFCNPEFTGVVNATIELFENSIPCGELISNKEVSLVAKALKDNNIKEVIFSGFLIGWNKLAKKLHQNNIIVKTYFHGSHSQYLDEYGWEMTKQIYLLEKKHIVSEMAFCKESIIDFYNSKNCNTAFLKNIVNIDYNIEKYQKNKDEFKIGVYAVHTANIKKNVFSSLASIYFIQKANPEKKVIADIVPITDISASFCHLLDIETTGVNKGIPRDELLNRMNQCDINLYVTFTECAPMLPLESFYVGTPCITGNNHHYFKGQELEKYLVVKNENSPLDISEKVKFCLENKDRVLKLYDKFREDNLKDGKKLVKQFLDVRNDKNGAV